MRVFIPWAGSKQEFLKHDLSGRLYVTKSQCYQLGFAPDFSEEKSIDWLRLFCNRHHPGIDFDNEFETDKPGVYGRYERKFGRDYEQGLPGIQYETVKDQLLKIGYELPWED